MKSSKPISQYVNEILAGDPVLQQCIKRGIVNYSKLARNLRNALTQAMGSDVSENAVKMALIRYAEKAKSEKRVLVKGVLEILAKSNIEVKSGITIINIRTWSINKLLNDLPKIISRARFSAIMQGVSALTLVLDNDSATDVLRTLDNRDIISVQEDHAALLIISPEEIMYTPGVVAYLTTVLAENGINIVHIESSYTDTIIIVSKNDVIRAFEVLNTVIGIARKINYT
ncbi:MAG: ACT domain-containing protein [Desulfurococcaceae archaeon]